MAVEDHGHVAGAGRLDDVDHPLEDDGVIHLAAVERQADAAESGLVDVPGDVGHGRAQGAVRDERTSREIDAEPRRGLGGRGEGQQGRGSGDDARKNHLTSPTRFGWNAVLSM